MCRVEIQHDENVTVQVNSNYIKHIHIPFSKLVIGWISLLVYLSAGAHADCRTGMNCSKIARFLA